MTDRPTNRPSVFRATEQPESRRRVVRYTGLMQQPNRTHATGEERRPTGRLIGCGTTGAIYPIISLDPLSGLLDWKKADSPPVDQTNSAIY